MAIRLVHYINQFYAGIGGEEVADTEPFVAETLPPISEQLQKKLGDQFEVVAAVVCGDSYYNENEASAKETILGMIKEKNPDFFIAGPAFNAGRYGVAAGSITAAVKEELDIPAITGMYTENPGADMFKKDVYIVETKDSAAGMRKAIKSITSLAKKLANDEEVSPKADGYMAQGVRKNYFAEENGSQRAVKMLLKKINGEEFETEYPMPTFDRVDPAPAIKDMSSIKIALVTSGGIVPKGNPDKIESSSASKYGRYEITGIDAFTSENAETAHGGYDPTYANTNPNRVLPLDVVRNMVEEGKIGSLHEYYYSTVGNGTAIASAKKYGEEIAEYLKEDKVDAVILTSTWGTCTRCGATMVKAIEAAGFPVVHMCTITPISMTIGANRIVPTIAIPYPLGNPELSDKDEYDLRYELVDKALKALETEISEQTVFEN